MAARAKAAEQPAWLRYGFRVGEPHGGLERLFQDDTSLGRATKTVAQRWPPLAAKCSFAEWCVCKGNLGTRRRRSPTAARP